MLVTSLTIIPGSCLAGRTIHSVRHDLTVQEKEDTERRSPIGFIDPATCMTLHIESSLYHCLFLQGKTESFVPHQKSYERTNACFEKNMV